MIRRVVIVVLVVLAATVVAGMACPAEASRPQGRPSSPRTGAVMTFEQKMAWILMLEDRRVLADAQPFPATPAPPPAPAGKTDRKAAAVPRPPSPDLRLLLADNEARIRRRAALAAGRVGLAAGAPLLTPLLVTDPEPEVRQMAAFALGLIGSRSALEPLYAALADPAPMVQGRAAEALARIGDLTAAPAIVRMASAHAAQPHVAALAPADEAFPQSPEAEAFRLALYALVRLKAWDALASLAIRGDGTPVSRWWPVAYALGRMEDPRAVPGLMAMARATDGGIGRAFAARGLGAQKVASGVPVLATLADAWRLDPRAAVQAIRALGQIGTADGAAVLRRMVQTNDTEPTIRLEAVTALGAAGDAASLNVMLDLLADPWPAMRAAALRGARAADPDHFLAVLSGLDPDPHVSGRMALASMLAELDADVAVPRLKQLAADADVRVLPPAIAALARIKAPDLGPSLMGWLGHDDVIVRAAAASAIGELKVPGAEAALATAYHGGVRDTAYNARAAVLGALRQYGAGVAMPVLREALTDKDWAVRVRAAALMHELDPAADTGAAMRPGPARPDSEYTQPGIVDPGVSPHVYFETDKGTVEIELFVLDAPQASENFLKLARQGYFTGVAIHRVVPNFVVQDGDPRGDGEGGPGYTIRDEINQQPYLRGTVGMALEWADTGGSQWFITHSPQPHLDGRYTAFGRVVAGMDVVDRLQQWDVIRRVRTWDGVMMTTR
ncbi:MAG: HEAT repeat domain-containing protein [Vicinamibacterales bacterium]|nr:HEAT repeat domain-containing protein [Vicinamibacterales bacterium]